MFEVGQSIHEILYEIGEEGDVNCWTGWLELRL